MKLGSVTSRPDRVIGLHFFNPAPVLDLVELVPSLLTGSATVDDVDAATVHGCAHPMGPLRLADLVGIDTSAAIASSMYGEFKEPLYSPPPMLLRMVEAGLLGREAGRGSHDYAATTA